MVVRIFGGRGEGFEARVKAGGAKVQWVLDFWD
jgi:hypothetical protein